MYLIGIYGKAESGKDTIGNYLVRTKGAQKGAFAFALKEYIGRNVLGLSDEQLYGNMKEVVDPRFGKTARQLLQYLGTDVFRKLYGNIWTEAEIRRFNSIQRVPSCGSAYVICDVRFRNEMEAIKENKGYIWKVVREDHQGASSGITGHPSEVDMDGVPDEEFDLVIRAKSGEIDKICSIADKEYERLVSNGR